MASRRGGVKGLYTSETPGYAGMHARLKYAKGKASQYLCTQCGKQAQEWAYDHSDPEPVVDHHGHEYSVDMDRYKPMCLPCHRSFDMRGTCRKGHPRTEKTAYLYRGWYVCRVCNTEKMREYRKRKKEANG